MSTANPAFSTVPANERVAYTNEKVTGPPGREMLRLAAMSETNDAVVLDNATGAGVITNAILEIESHSKGTQIQRIVSGDIDDSMIDLVKRRQQSSKSTEAAANWNKVEVEKVDQQAIPYLDTTFTHVFSNFGVFFCHDDSKALAETFRVLKPSGTAGFTSWKSIAWWSEVAQPALNMYLTDAPALPSPSGLFPTTGWTSAESTAQKLRTAGFVDVDATEYAFTPDVESRDFAEATGFLVKAVAGRLWPEDVFRKLAGQIEPALLRYLQENYEDGRWDGKMTAIISIGKRE